MFSRIGAVLAALAVFTGSLLVAPTAQAAGEDCGTGADAYPPSGSAIPLTSGGGCSGTHDGEPYDFYAGCSWYCARDDYRFTAHEGDLIRVSFSRSCSYTTWWSDAEESTLGNGYLIADDAGTSTYTISVATLGPFDGSGCYGTTNYFIGVTILSNDKPVISSTAGPTNVLPGDPYRFEVTASDPDGNLKEVGAVLSSVDTVWSPVDSTGKGGVELSFTQDRAFSLAARDDYGARSDLVAHSVSLYEDDCGSGQDIAGYLSVPFGGQCRAHLASSLNDDHDGFQVEVPPGAQGRLALESVGFSGFLVADFDFTSPSGTVYRTTNNSIYLPEAEPGVWTIDANRWTRCCPDVYTGGYDLRVREIGEAAPPIPTAQATPGNIHRFESTTVHFSAVDPNDQYVSYRIDWGDGESDLYRSGVLFPSGTSGSLSHTYHKIPHTPPTITAINDEGLSGTAVIPLTVRGPDDWCQGRASDTRDAPSYTTGWSDSDRAHYDIVGGGHCEAELGYVVSRSGGVDTIDAADVFRFWGCLSILGTCNQDRLVGTPLRITVETTSVGVRVRVQDLLSTKANITIPPDSQRSITVLAPHYLLHYLIVDSPVGKGSYTVDISPTS